MPVLVERILVFSGEDFFGSPFVEMDFFQCSRVEMQIAVSDKNATY